MALIDFLLNLVGLVLWFSWCSSRLDPLRKSSPASLAGTLRRAEPRRFEAWHFLVALAALLVLRALVYWQVGPAVDWTAKLDLVMVALAFRSDLFPSALLYSLLSFGRALLIFYFWLLVLGLLNRRVVEPGPVHRAVRLHLGRLGRWPWPVQLVLPLLLAAVLWIVLQPLLVASGITSRASSPAHLIEQGVLVGGALYLSLKYLFPAFLFLHLTASYVYLGSSPIWPFIATTSRSLLAPLRWLPLRFARLDLAPLLGVILILLGLHVLPNFILRKMLENNLPIWPQ